MAAWRAVLRGISGKGLFAVGVWGASFAATRVAVVDSLTPFGLVALRLWAGALLLAGLLAAGRATPLGRARQRSLLPAPADWGACVFLGGVLALHLFLQAYGLKFTTAVHTGWIIGFIPVTVALGAHLLGQQRIFRTGWIGVGLGAGGILLVLVSTMLAHGFGQGAQRQFGGDLLQVGSCLTWTVYTLAATAAVARSGALRVTMVSMAIAAGANTLPALETGWLHAPWTWGSVVALVFLGPVCSGVAYYAWFAAQREQGPARLNALIYIEPFVSMAVGAALLGERVTAAALAGGLLVLAGVWLVSRGSGRPAVAAVVE
ncbi:MAG: DMT family transporter [Planctomycetota bacterium]